MIITRIKLNNWKNFAEVDVSCGKRVFLAGPNAAGKSNFLDALRFLKDVAQFGLEHAVVKQRGGVRQIRYINAKNPQITISVVLDHLSAPGNKLEYSLTFGTGKGQNIPRVVAETVAEFSDGKWHSILKRPDHEDRDDPTRLTQTALQQINANKAFREIPDFLSTIQYQHILPQLVRNPGAFSSWPVSNDPFGRDFVYTVWKTPEKTRNARLHRINEILRIAIPGFKNLATVQDRNGTPRFEVTFGHWRRHDTHQNESSLSDGTLRLIGLLWSLCDTPGPLLLEEPELSLHEEIVAQLPILFATLDTDKKEGSRQIFLTTHSACILRAPGIAPDEILHFSPNKEGGSVLSPSYEDKTKRDFLPPTFSVPKFSWAGF